MIRSSFRLVLLLSFTFFLIACGNGPDIRPLNVADLQPTTNPLVAQYSVHSAVAGQAFVEFGTDTHYGLQTASYDVSGGITAPILVAGMLPSTTYHMRAHVVANGATEWVDNDRVFTTGSLPVPPPSLAVTRPTPNAQPPENGGVELVSFFPPSGSPPTLETFVTDRNGRTIWYYNPSDRVPSIVKPMPNGHFLALLSSSTTLPSAVREIDLAGNTINEIDSDTLQQKLAAAGYTFNFVFFHHDVLPLPNGHIIVLGQTTQDFNNLLGYPGTTTVEGDVLVDLDQNWNPVWAWNTFDYLDVNRHLMGLPDWTHSNAVAYNPADGNLLLSIRHQSWIVGIDYQNGAGTGHLLWRLGEGGDFTLAGGNPADWFYAEHYPAIINSSGSAITFSVFDNGNLRIFDNMGTTCGIGSAPVCYSRAAIFQMDQSTRTAQLLWQYLPGVFSFWGGTATQLPNGNVEFEMSAPFAPTLGSRAMEVTQTATPQVVWQMDLTGGSSYRTYRIPSLYPNVSWP